MLLLSSMDAACFSRVDPEEIKYMTLKTRVKMLGDIQFARSHKLLPNGLSWISSCTISYWPVPSVARLRCGSSAVRLLRLWVRIPPVAWMFVCCECFVLSGRGLRDGLITRPEESYRLWRVVVCDQETSKTRRLKPATRLWKYKHNGL